MKKILLLIVFISSIANAQFTVKGTMMPPDKGDWVVLYKIEGAKQKYISNTTIKIENINIGGQNQKVGRFEIKLPEAAKVGAYRVTYRDKGAGFVDFLFNKENVEFVFNPEYPDQSIAFTKSLENKVYRDYMESLNFSQRKIDSLQMAYITQGQEKSTKKAYSEAIDEAENAQDIYEGKSKGMLAHDFIVSSKNPYASSPFNSIQDYMNTLTGDYLSNVDFKNESLYNSSFLIDKITDYVFLLNVAEEQTLQQKIYKESIATVMDKVGGDKSKLRKEALEFLIGKFTDARNSEIVDLLFSKYYDNLSPDLKDSKLKIEKMKLLRASVGRTAPDFSWKEGGKPMKLSTLKDGENYLVIFWSTGCSHCLEEIPELYKYMKKFPKTSVVAFGIEREEFEWNEYVKKLYGWHNVMGTHPENKWDNETVKTYQLIGTPSYFVLDKDKKIIAMPNSFKDVQTYMNNSTK